MKCILDKEFFKDFHYDSETYYDALLKLVPWSNVGAPRMECFMASKSMKYGYDTREGLRFYDSVPFHTTVYTIMSLLNDIYKTDYNVCFLNYYENEKQHLGWHADDSEGMDLEHPIAVVSFGESRYIYTKPKTHKGKIDPSDMFLLNDGSLFIMPAGFQKEHYHKIPKGDRMMTGRISLTFRHYIPPTK